MLTKIYGILAERRTLRFFKIPVISGEILQLKSCETHAISRCLVQSIQSQILTAVFRNDLILQFMKGRLPFFKSSVITETAVF